MKFMAKPLVLKTKEFTKENRSGMSEGLQKAFIWLGNTIYEQESKLSRKAMNLKGDSELFRKSVSNHEALDMGIEYFYDFVLFGFLFSVSLYEIFNTFKKEEELDLKIQKIEDAFDNRFKKCKTQLKNQKSSKEEREMKNKENGKCGEGVFPGGSFGSQMEGLGKKIEEISSKIENLQKRIETESLEFEFASKEIEKGSKELKRLQENSHKKSSAIHFSQKITDILSMKMEKH